MSNLIEEFYKLKNEYHAPKTPDKRKNELFEQMKLALIEINDNKDYYEFKMNFNAKGAVQISQCANPADLYEILGDIVANNNSSTLTEIAEQSRAQQMKQNKFSKDNPYPQTKK